MIMSSKNISCRKLLTIPAKQAEVIKKTDSHTLSHEHCHTTIVGTCNPDHLQENIASAAKGPLPEDLLERVAFRVAALKP